MAHAVAVNTILGDAEAADCVVLHEAADSTIVPTPQQKDAIAMLKRHQKDTVYSGILKTFLTKRQFEIFLQIAEAFVEKKTKDEGCDVVVSTISQQLDLVKDASRPWDPTTDLVALKNNFKMLLQKLKDPEATMGPNGERAILQLFEAIVIVLDELSLATANRARAFMADPSDSIEDEIRDKGVRAEALHLKKHVIDAKFYEELLGKPFANLLHRASSCRLATSP